MTVPHSGRRCGSLLFALVLAALGQVALAETITALITRSSTCAPALSGHCPA